MLAHTEACVSSSVGQVDLQRPWLGLGFLSLSVLMCPGAAPLTLHVLHKATGTGLGVTRTPGSGALSLEDKDRLLSKQSKHR